MIVLVAGPEHQAAPFSEALSFDSKKIKHMLVGPDLTDYYVSLQDTGKLQGLASRNTEKVVKTVILWVERLNSSNSSPVDGTVKRSEGQSASTSTGPTGGWAIRGFMHNGKREKVLACVFEKFFLIIRLTIYEWK
ncbi:hypothetical protein [Planococcus maitriensis]|uniref:hypothetical protein n=1 Tax=Planococcus maitriensis TaxID=221799 RepID=UPI0011BF0309|nr:hypothetical protein [Planococcus maitriensis]